jgi:hydroxymethylpyrimidine pyrophosphatase-like HAD family hydrolase
MGIKAIIMDGDGSTITHNNIFPDNFKQLIMDNQQIKWAMATGRSLELLKKTPIIDYLSTDIVHIVDGGSCLMDLNARCKVRHLMSTQELDFLFSRLDFESINFLYYSPDGLNSYVYSNNKDIKNNFIFHDTYVNYTNKVSIFREWTNKYPPGKILLNRKNKFDLTDIYYHQNEDNYDITLHGVNKGSACIGTVL